MKNSTEVKEPVLQLAKHSQGSPVSKTIKCFLTAIFLLNVTHTIHAIQPISKSEESLLMARKEIQNKNFDLASQYYNTINFDSDSQLQWREKTLDALRFQLIQQKPRQAMQILSLLQFLRLETSDIIDYKFLALFKLDICLLAYTPQTQWQKLIQAAYYFRLADLNYTPPEYLFSFFPTESALTLYGRFELNEINRLEWIAGQGCRFNKAKAPSIKDNLNYALVLLSNIKSEFNTTMKDSSQIELAYMIDMLIVHTAFRLEDQSIIDSTEKKILSMPISLWSEVPFPLAEKVFETLKKRNNTKENQVQFEKIAEHMATNLPPQRLGFWFNQLPIPLWILDRQKEFIKNLVIKHDKPENSYLFLYLAVLANRTGNYQESLKYIAKVFEEENEEVYGQTEKLLQSIIEKYLFDDRFYGALTASLPQSLFQEKLFDVALNQAFSAETIGYQQVIKAIESTNLRRDSSLIDVKRLHQSILQRNFSSFYKQISDHQKGSRTLGRWLLRAYTGYYTKGLQISEPEFLTWRSYFEQIHKLFTRQNKPFLVDESIHKAMASRLGGIKQQGIEVVQGKTTYIGKVSIKPDFDFISPFKTPKIPDELKEVLLFKPESIISDKKQWTWGRL